MGVDRDDYVIFGVNVGYDNVDYDDFEDEICGAPGARFRIIYDGMSGNYAWACAVLAKGDHYEGFDNGIELRVTDGQCLGTTALEIIRRFPDLDLTIQDFKFMAISHFH
jgi:hypothetical protein